MRRTLRSKILMNELTRIHAFRTATQNIQAIKNRKPYKQATVVAFAHKFDAGRQLSGEELTFLVSKMVETTNLLEEARLRDQIIRGFYGDEASD